LAVVSYDMLNRRVDQLIDFAAEVIVLDEASALKNTGPRADAAQSVIDPAWRRLALTATPMEVDGMETYRLLRLLGARKLPAEDAFARYLLWQEFPDGERKAIGVRPEALPMLRAALAPYVLRREVDQLGVRLPGLVEEQVWIALTPPQEAAYRAAATAWNDLQRAQRRDKACTVAQGRSAKAEAAVAWLSSHREVGKAVIFAENLEHLTITQRLLDAAGIRWVRIDGSTARVRRADAVDVFRHDPAVRVLLGTRVLERGIDGLQHAGVLLSLGSSFNPAREAQRIGRLRRPGAAHPEVRHVTFLADTDHERRKWATLTRRASDSEAVLGRSGLR
jgi:superfamily II DNA or RNA helicase